MISPRVRRLRLAYELRELRQERGMTHARLASAVGFSRQQISRLENGHGPPDQGDVVRILDALGIEGQRWTQVLTIAQEAASPGWWESDLKAIGERQAVYADLEVGASSIREYQQTLIPGLLQTSEFTRTRAAVGRPGLTTPEGIVKGRVGRQRMLNRPGGPSYEVVLDEVAVRRISAPPNVLREQLRYMAERAGEDRVTIRVLPVGARIAEYVLPECSFSLYDYPDPGDPVVVGIESVTTDIVLTDAVQITYYVEMYDRLRQAALPAEDAPEYLIKAAEELPTE